MNKLSAKLISVIYQKDIARAYEDGHTVYYYERNDCVVKKLPLIEYLSKLTQFFKSVDTEFDINKITGTMVLNTKFKNDFFVGETPKELLLKVGKGYLKSYQLQS